MTAAPLVPKAPVAPPEFAPTPFLSPRNLPLWAGVVFVLIIAGLVVWLG